MLPSNSNRLAIREARIENVPAITEIFNDAILTTTAVYYYEPVSEQNRLQWLEARLKGNWPVFIADHDGKVVGFGTYGPFRPSPAYQYSVEHSIYVHAGHRRQGIGKILLTALIESAKARGFHVMIAGIDSANAASLRLHEHFGFAPVAHFKEVGFKFDRWLDLLFMQLWLGGPATHPARR